MVQMRMSNGENDDLYDHIRTEIYVGSSINEVIKLKYYERR
jgi:hypothetical protein